MRVAFSLRARRDRRDAQRWYREVSPAAAERFQRELQEAVEFIAEYPEGAPLFHGEARGKTMAHFPYSILYVIEPRRVLIVAVADDRRDPGTYNHRLR